jgi:hypothetical protein
VVTAEHERVRLSLRVKRLKGLQYKMLLFIYELRMNSNGKHMPVSVRIC